MTTMTQHEYLTEKYGTVGGVRWDGFYLDMTTPGAMPVNPLTFWNPLRKRDQLLELCQTRLDELFELSPQTYTILSFDLDEEYPSDYMLLTEADGITAFDIPRYPLGHGQAAEVLGEMTNQLNVLVLRQEGVSFLIVSAYYGEAIPQGKEGVYLRCLGKPTVEVG